MKLLDLNIARPMKITKVIEPVGIVRIVENSKKLFFANVKSSCIEVTSCPEMIN